MSALRQLAERVFNVTVLTPEGSSPAGQVKMKTGAGYDLMEAKLSKVGVYAPRGEDSVSWTQRGATITDGEGHPIVKLTHAKGAHHHKGSAVGMQLPPGTRRG